MHFKHILIISLILLLTGCGKSAAVTDQNVNLEQQEAEDKQAPGGRYSDASSEDTSLEDEIMAAPEVIEYSQRVTVLPEPVIEPEEQTVTMMVYMIGSDLESKGGAATNDMEEMASSGVDLSKVNLLVYTGGCENWFSDISNESNCILQLTDNGFNKVKEYNSKSMGDPACLSDFLKYAYQNYKTDSYNLILWDHGNGPVMGYGKDRLYDGDSMSLAELGDALNASPFNQENKLGFVGFDACLMSSAELACTLEDYADYLVASQEVEPNFGWNYSFLKDCGKISNASLAQCAVRDYINACNDYFQENENFCNDITLACMDLSYGSELRDTINNLFKSAAEDVSGSYNMLALERYHSRGFGRATTGSEYDLVDLSSLMSAMSEKYPSQTQKVQNVIDKMVSFCAHNTTDCSGMSIYYPYFNKKHFSSQWRDDYKAVNQFTAYQEYLSRFEQVWLGTDMMSLFTEPLSPEEYTPGTYALELSDKQAECYQSSGYYILRKDGDGIYSPVSYSHDVELEGNTLTADYEGRTLMVSDDFGNKYSVISNVTDVNGDNYYHSVRATARDSYYENADAYPTFNRIPAEILLDVNHATNSVSVMGYYELSEEDTKADAIQSGKKVPLNTDEYMVMSFAQRLPMYPQRDENGILRPISEWLSSNLTGAANISYENGIHFTYEPLYDDGNEYFLMFDIADTQNNHYCSELMPVQLAKAPEVQEKDIPVSNYKWDDPVKPPVIEKSGAKMTLCETKIINRNNAPFYGLLIENSNEHPVEVKMKDIFINDSCSGEYVLRSSDAVIKGYPDVFEIAEAEEMLRYSGKNHLDKLRFKYQVCDFTTGKVLSDWEEAVYEISDSVTPKLNFVDYYGLSVKPQTLVDNETLKVELLNCGHYIGETAAYARDSIHMRLKVTNKTEERLSFSTKKCYVNGYAFALNGIGQNGLDIPPKESGYMFAGSDSLPTRLIDEGIVFLGIIAEYNFMDMLAVEIEIDEPDDAACTFVDDYPCVYEDEVLKIYDYGVFATNEYNMIPNRRGLIIQNKTNADVMLTENEKIIRGDYPGSYISLSMGNVGAGDVIIKSININEAPPSTAFAISWHAYSLGLFEEGVDYDIPLIELEELE